MPHWASRGRGRERQVSWAQAHTAIPAWPLHSFLLLAPDGFFFYSHIWHFKDQNLCPSRFSKNVLQALRALPRKAFQRCFQQGTAQLLGGHCGELACQGPHMQMAVSSYFKEIGHIIL